jgi:CRP/FNR family transcriptional regulator
MFNKISTQTLFPNFDSSLLKNILEHSTIVEAQAGTVLMRTGQYIRNTVLVTKGKIKVYREDEEGNEFFMYYLLPGQACAISMICATKSEKSQIMAKVVEDAELIMVPLQLMDKWMTEHRSWYEFVIDTYRSRFEEVLIVIDSIAFRSMDERLEFYLKRNVITNQTNDIQISHQEIANDLSSTREVISRLLKKMEQRGFVKLHRSHIELLK